MKRWIDLSIGIGCFILLAPFMLVIALAIVLESGLPAFYAPQVIGKDGKPFRFLRFRTMRNQLDLPADARLTRVGRWIRNLSLDHLPNVFNLVRGDVSIVGPRPTEPERIDLSDPTWTQILSVRPGIFSYAILMLARDFNKSSQIERNLLEAEYVERQSLAFDSYIFLASLVGWISSKGNIKRHGQRRAAINHPTTEDRSQA